jgi:WD40 repeat protein
MSERDELGNTQLSSARSAGGTTPTERTPLPGVASDRFGLPEGVLDPELGRGGMGRVLRLHDAHLGREVAVKELLPAHREDAVMETLFVREARVLARLEHPGVVPVYELGRRPDGTPFYAMRRIRGRSLQQVLETCASLNDRLSLLGHFLTVVQTMGFAHSRGVVHRDLKPENVMVSGFGETLVIDWGLAIVEGVVTTGVTAGTPAYMAPEQCAGTGVDAQSDVWSLGVMLFELLTSKLPFQAATSSDVLNLVQRSAVPAVSDLEPQAPAPLARVVERALQPDPSARYANAGDMADALEAAMRERVPRQRGPQLAAVSLGVMLVGALGWAFSARSGAEDARRDARVQVSDAQRASASAIAGNALAALRARDTLEAGRLAALLPHHPLAAGVALLAREVGVPTQVWTVKTEAGCAALAAVGHTIACPTLNEVLLFDRAGKQVGALATGPRGWQHAAVALPDLKLLTGGDDRVLRTWSLVTRQLYQESPPFDAGITALAADGAEVVLGFESGDVTRFSGTLLHHHQRPVLALKAAGGVVVSTSGDSTYVLRPDGEATLDRRAGAIELVGETLVLGVERAVVDVGHDGRARAWGNHLDDVSALTVLEGRVISGGLDRVVRWWSRTNEPEGLLSGFEHPVRALTAVGNLLVVAAGRQVSGYSLPPTREAAWSDRPSALAVSTMRKQLFAGFLDGRVQRYDQPTRQTFTLELRHTAAVRAVVEVPGEEAPDKLRVLSAGDDGQVRAQRWNGAVEALEVLPGARVLALAVSGDAHRAAWSVDDGSLVLYSLEFGKEIARTKAAIARTLAFSPDGRTLVVGRDDRRLALINAETGALELETHPFDAEVSAVGWASGDLIVAGRTDGTLSAYSRAQQRLTTQWTGLPRARVSALNVRGQLLLAGSEDGRAWAWSLEGGGPVLEVPSDSGAVGAIDLVDNALIYSGTDRLVHVLPLGIETPR